MDILKRSFLMVALVCLLPHSARGQISPGPLARPHESLEGMKNCLKCHKLGSGPDAEKCLACHQEIQVLVEQKRGYHYRMVEIEKAPCFGCHGDHAGKDFELVHWEGGRDRFEHEKTGYELTGAHGRADCRDCHRADFIQEDLRKLQQGISMSRTFLGLSGECTACHADEHRGQLQDACQTCHGDEHWRPAPGFDHDKARFRLTGLHRSVRCDACHPVTGEEPASYTRYRDVAFAACRSCHQDPHNGRFAKPCESCHSTAGWRNVQLVDFDHSKTSFPLVGRHASVACEKCHATGSNFAGVAHETCAICHADVHRGQFNRYTGCESCHDENGFTPVRFSVADHARTRFPLEGAHVAQPCVACHQQATAPDGTSYRQFAVADTRCETCHNDVHMGQFAGGKSPKECTACHGLDRWALADFDHDRDTSYKLEGAHRKVACASCHLEVVEQGRSFVRYRPIDPSCKNCHTQEGIELRGL